jgi:hypothetical protein
VRLVVLLPAIALASPSPEVTREFQAGVDAFRLGNFADARTHLDKAHALDPALPGPERYLAAVAQAEGRWQDCIDAARLALQLNPHSLELAETRHLHDACRTAAGRAPFRGELGESAAIDVASSVPGASVTIRGLGFGATPFPPRRINPGPLDIAIAKQGYLPLQLHVDAIPGVVTDVRVELEPDLTSTPPAPGLVAPPGPVQPRGCGCASTDPTGVVIFVPWLFRRRRAALQPASRHSRGALPMIPCPSGRPGKQCVHSRFFWGSPRVSTGSRGRTSRSTSALPCLRRRRRARRRPPAR